MRRLTTTQLLFAIGVLFACAALMLGVGVASGAAESSSPTPEIVGVWSFNGGTVDIVPQPDGSYTGIVSKPTKFSKCVHPLEEHMWTQMRLQSDGSYWGFHQWYFGEGSHCIANKVLGPTAWRVLHNEKGEKFLRVCFSEPGSGLQPTIAANGSSANVDYGCENSALVAAVPPPPTLRASTTLPPSTKCIGNTLRLELRKRKYDPFKQLTIKIDGMKVLQINGVKRLRKPVVLTHLPNDTFTVQILATTVLGQHLSGKRTYSACGGSSSEVNLHEVKKHRHRRRHHRHHHR